VTVVAQRANDDRRNVTLIGQAKRVTIASEAGVGGVDVMRRALASSDSARKMSRQSRRDSGVVEEERQIRSHAFTAGEYAQAVE